MFLNSAVNLSLVTGTFPVLSGVNPDVWLLDRATNVSEVISNNNYYNIVFLGLYSDSVCIIVLDSFNSSVQWMGLR